MKTSLYSLRKVGKSKKRKRQALDFMVVYMVNHGPGHRFHYRTAKTVRGWNPAVRVDLEEQDRKITFSNRRDASQCQEDFKVFALSSVRQPDLCADLILDLNEADKASDGGYDLLVELFNPRLAWGNDFVRDEVGLRVLEEQQQQVPPGEQAKSGDKLEELQLAVENHAADLDAKLTAIHSELALLREDRKTEDYMKLASAARKCKNPAPFSSVKDAEVFLAGSSVAMDGLKAIFSQQNFALQTRMKNDQRRVEGKPGSLPCASLFDFLFTYEVKLELMDFSKFSSLGPATVEFFCDRARYLLGSPAKSSNSEIMGRLRHHIRDATRKKH